MRLRSTLVAALATCALAALPSAASARSCNVQRDGRSFGVTYVTSLTASGVSCTTAKRTVRAFHSCRKRNGGMRGRCTRTSGYRCSERRGNMRNGFSGKVTCRRGSRRVVHTYAQFT